MTTLEGLYRMNLHVPPLVTVTPACRGLRRVNVDSLGPLWWVSTCMLLKKGSRGEQKVIRGGSHPLVGGPTGGLEGFLGDADLNHSLEADSGLRASRQKTANHKVVQALLVGAPASLPAAEPALPPQSLPPQKTLLFDIYTLYPYIYFVHFLSLLLRRT